MSDTAQIQAGAFSSGTVEQPGIISLTATESISFTGSNTGIFSNNDPGSLGDAGDTQLSAPNITLNDGAVITATNKSNGQGGNITLSTEQLTLNNGSSITTSSSGQGNAGNITVEVMDNFTASNSLITSNIGSPQGEAAVGQVGSIDIKARKVIFSDTAQIQAGLFSGATGNPGIVSITASESISFTGENTGIFSNNDPDSIGKASDTQLSAPTISLSKNAVITASNNGQGGGW